MLSAACTNLPMNLILCSFSKFPMQFLVAIYRGTHPNSTAPRFQLKWRRESVLKMSVEMRGKQKNSKLWAPLPPPWPDGSLPIAPRVQPVWIQVRHSVCSTGQPDCPLQVAWFVCVAGVKEMLSDQSGQSIQLTSIELERHILYDQVRQNWRHVRQISPVRFRSDKKFFRAHSPSTHMTIK
jgi:hypothetical protein